MNEGAAGRTLRDARLAAGLTQERLAELSELTVRTVRGLECGQVTSPRRGSVERLAAALSMGVLERDRLLASWSVAEPHLGAEATPIFGQVDTTGRLERLARSAVRTASVLSLSEKFQVDHTRRPVSWRTEEVITSRVDELRSRTVFYEPDEPDLDAESFSLSDLENCLPGEQTLVAGRYKIFELLFDSPLRRGDSKVYRYSANFGWPSTADGHAGPSGGSCFGGFFRPPASFVLQVQFDPGTRPRRCVQVFQGRPAGRVQTVRELSLDAWSTVHLALTRPAAGGHGIAWSW